MGANEVERARSDSGAVTAKRVLDPAFCIHSLNEAGLRMTQQATENITAAVTVKPCRLTTGDQEHSENESAAAIPDAGVISEHSTWSKQAEVVSKEMIRLNAAYPSAVVPDQSSEVHLAPADFFIDEEALDRLIQHDAYINSTISSSTNSELLEFPNFEEFERELSLEQSPFLEKILLPLQGLPDLEDQPDQGTSPFAEDAATLWHTKTMILEAKSETSFQSDTDLRPEAGLHDSEDVEEIILDEGSVAQVPQRNLRVGATALAAWRPTPMNKVEMTKSVNELMDTTEVRRYDCEDVEIILDEGSVAKVPQMPLLVGDQKTLAWIPRPMNQIGMTKPGNVRRNDWGDDVEEIILDEGSVERVSERPLQGMALAWSHAPNSINIVKANSEHDPSEQAAMELEILDQGSVLQQVHALELPRRLIAMPCVEMQSYIPERKRSSKRGRDSSFFNEAIPFKQYKYLN